MLVEPGGIWLSSTFTFARSYGSWGEISGAASATITIATKTKKAATATRLSEKSAMKRLKGASLPVSASGAAAISETATVIAVPPGTAPGDRATNR